MSADLIARGLAACAKLSCDAGDLAHARSARRILRASARGITSIASVMASAPTYTEGVSGANSTIITSATIASSGGSYNTSDTTRFSSNGYFAASQNGTAGMTDRSVTRLTGSSQGYRCAARSATFIFGRGGDQFGLCGTPETRRS